MQVHPINKNSRQAVAGLMVRLKPEWWDIAGAAAQLAQGTGWYLAAAEEKPLGWLLCRAHRGYRTLEVECLGYDSEGSLLVGPPLEPLLKRAQDWAREHEMAAIAFIIGSEGLSCHGRTLSEPWRELKELRPIDREEYDWFISLGFHPAGILPHIYKRGHHGIILLKSQIEEA